LTILVHGKAYKSYTMITFAVELQSENWKMFRRMTYGSMALLLLVPLVPIYIVASLANEFYSLNAMPIGSLYMLGLALTLIPLVLMPSKIKSNSKLKLLRTVLLVACALFMAVTVFASTSPVVSGHVPSTATTISHYFTSTTRTYSYATTTTQCVATTVFEYYGAWTSTECYYITLTGATWAYSTSWVTSTTGSSARTTYVTPTTTVTYGVSLVVSPVIYDVKTTKTYTTTVYEYYRTLSTGWSTFTSTGDRTSVAITVVTYTTGSSASSTYGTTETSYGPQVDYVYVTTTMGVQTVYATTSVTPTTVYGYLAKESAGPAIYYIYGGKKYHITSWAAYLAYGFRPLQWKTASAAELAYTSGYNLDGDAPLPPLLLPNGALMGDESDSAVYLVIDGTRRHIVSAAVFTACGYNWGDVIWVPHEHVVLYTSGADVTASPPPWPPA